MAGFEALVYAVYAVAAVTAACICTVVIYGTVRIVRKLQD